MRAESITAWSGPLPAPDDLAAYNAAVPNGAERILCMAEQQQTHRHGLETRTNRSNVIAEHVGMWFAFILGMSALGCGTWLIANDKSAEGIAMILTALASLAGLFIWGRRGNINAIAQKRAEEIVRQRGENPR